MHLSKCQSKTLNQPILKAFNWRRGQRGKTGKVCTHNAPLMEHEACLCAPGPSANPTGATGALLSSWVSRQSHVTPHVSNSPISYCSHRCFPSKCPSRVQNLPTLADSSGLALLLTPGPLPYSNPSGCSTEHRLPAYQDILSLESHITNLVSPL